MDAKIKWYQEVLELEPSSKVFFPLARLLADNAQLDDAVTVLRQGLDRNPDHVEAQLLLVEVLHRRGEDAEARERAQGLAHKMGNYPAFWQAWAESLSEDDGHRDPALALNFLAAHFQGTDISWAQVIQTGLQTLLGGEAPAAAPEPPRAAEAREAAEAAEALDILEKEDEAGETAAQAEELDLEPDFEFEEAGEAPQLEVMEEPWPGGEEDEAAEPSVAEAPEPGEEDEGDETFSLRTKTMAVVLAEQGDYDGAMDIYRELLAAASDEDQREELERRIQELEERRRETAGEASEGDDNVLQGKSKLINTLEALAQRLEARAAG